jgi:hypothetical protein
LDEKALEFKKLQTPLHEELYETSMRSSKILASIRLAKSFIAPLNPIVVKKQMHNPNKPSSDISGRSIGISNQKSEMNVSSRSPMELEHLLPMSIVPLFWKFCQ